MLKSITITHVYREPVVVVVTGRQGVGKSMASSVYMKNTDWGICEEIDALERLKRWKGLSGRDFNPKGVFFLHCHGPTPPAAAIIAILDKHDQDKIPQRTRTRGYVLNVGLSKEELQAEFMKEVDRLITL